MKDFMPAWRERLVAIKESMKARGEIGGDSEIANRVTELLSLIDQPKVERAAINHWFRGRTLPNVAQFVALCRVLKADPSKVISDEPSIYALRQDTTPYQAYPSEIIELIENLTKADKRTRRLAIAAAEGVLEAAAD